MFIFYLCYWPLDIKINFSFFNCDLWRNFHLGASHLPHFFSLPHFLSFPALPLGEKLDSKSCLQKKNGRLLEWSPWFWEDGLWVLSFSLSFFLPLHVYVCKNCLHVYNFLLLVLLVSLVGLDLMLLLVQLWAYYFWIKFWSFATGLVRYSPSPSLFGSSDGISCFQDKA